MSSKQGLLRPIEIHDDNKNLTTSLGAIVLDTEVYACILTLLKALETKLKVVDATFAVKLSDDFKVTFTTPALATITFTDTALGRLLGFRADIGATDSRVADDTPEYSFLFTNYSADNGRFSVDPRKQFSGATSVTGAMGGVRLSQDLYHRTFRWEAEPAAKVYSEAATVSYTWGTVFYPEADRCWNTFMEECRTVQLVATTADNVNPKGFYYLPRLDDYLGASPVIALPATMDSGGINFDLASGADDYVFCNIDPSGASEPTPFNDMIRTHYNLEARITTSVSPTP
jgi:hypothetical protein